MKELLDNGVIHNTNTNAVHIFEQYLTNEFSNDNCYDTMMKEALSEPGEDLTLENINKLREQVYKNLLSLTKKEIENRLLNKILKMRIKRNKDCGAPPPSYKEWNIKSVIKVYSAVKKLSIEDIRKYINNVKIKDLRYVFHINYLNNYYSSYEKRPST